VTVYKKLAGTTEDSFLLGNDRLFPAPLLQRVPSTARLWLPDLIRWYPLGITKEGYFWTDTAGNADLVKTDYSAIVEPTPSTDSTLGYAKGSILIDVVLNEIWMNSDPTAGTAVWRKIGESDTSNGDRSGTEFSLNNSKDEPFFEVVKITTPAIIAQFIFPGTDTTVPSTFKVIASRDGTNQTATVDIYDYTNANLIATIPFTSDVISIYSTMTLNNLPATEAIFELRAYVSSNQADSARIHFMSLR
jgi:hypothetical protein